MPLKLEVSIDRKSRSALRRALNKVPLDLQEKAGKKALRTFGGRITRRARPTIEWRKTAASLKTKIKKYRKTILWLIVGSKVMDTSKNKRRPYGMLRGRALRASYDTFSPGWRSHWEEFGFHSFRKGSYGLQGKKLGRGWRAGLKGRNGQFHRGSGSLGRAYTMVAPQYMKIMVDAIDKYLKKTRARAA